MANKKIIVLIFLFILCACTENKPSIQENKPMAKDVLTNRTPYVAEDCNPPEKYKRTRTDSIVIEYTDIDSITQFVRRISYLCPSSIGYDTIQYKLINEKTKAYIELPTDTTTKSVYLDIQTQDDIIRDVSSDTVLKIYPSEYSFWGKFSYVNCIKDSVKNMSYYVFKGNDIGFSRNSEGYYYFDSIFHLKKIYYDGKLNFSVN